MEDEYLADTNKNLVYCSIGRHLGRPIKIMDDMKSLHYVMLHFAGLKLPWEKNMRYLGEMPLAFSKNNHDAIIVSDINC